MIKNKFVAKEGKSADKPNKANEPSSEKDTRNLFIK